MCTDRPTPKSTHTKFSYIIIIASLLVQLILWIRKAECSYEQIYPPAGAVLRQLVNNAQIKDWFPLCVHYIECNIYVWCTMLHNAAFVCAEFVFNIDFSTQQHTSVCVDEPTATAVEKSTPTVHTAPVVVVSAAAAAFSLLLVGSQYTLASASHQCPCARVHTNDQCACWDWQQHAKYHILNVT